MANEFVVKNGLIVSGSTRVQGSVTATSFTGSFSGSIAFATSASYAATASYALNAGDSVWTGSAGNIYYSGGNVGIGTASPSNKLEVAGNIATDGNTNRYIKATGFISNQIGQLSDFTAFDAGYYILSGGGIQFVSAASNSVRITSTGNVGIGTTNPNEKLHAAGNIHAYAAGGIDAGLFASTSGGSTTIAIRSNGITHFNGGNVGIGTTSPSEKLHVYGTGDQIVKIENSGTYLMYVGLISNEGYIGSTNATPLGLYTNNVNRLYISTSGNVGIGTTNPIFKLQVAGSGYINGGNLYIDSGQFLYWGNSTQGIRGVNDTSLDFYAGSTVRMVVTAGGNVGIGTTNPVQRLHVNGNIYMPSTNFITWNNGDSEIGGLSSGYGIRFSVYDGSATMVERMRIVSSGNVGIGVSTPAAKLQVSGSTNVLNVRGSGSATTSSIFSVDGNNGRLFEVSDDLSNSLFSVNTIAGLPVIEAFSDYSVTMGTYGQYVLQVTGSNVGIGSSAPQAKLDVNGNVRAISFTGSFSGSATNAVSASYALTASYALNAGDSIWTGSAGNIYYNQGSVGIGTNSPQGGFKLDVDGSIVIRGEIYSNSSIIEFSANENYKIAQSGNTWLAKTSGNVGIGNTNPTTKLAVAGTIQSSAGGDWASNAGFTQLNHNGSGIGSLSMYYDTETLVLGAGITQKNNITISGHSADNLISFKVGNSERMRITSAGNVGIGITNPSQKLVVIGNTAISGVTYTDFVQTYSGASIDFRHQDASVVMRVDTANARVGIGTTSPAYKLDVIGSARIGQSSNSSTNAQLELTAGGSGYNAALDFGYYNTFDASIWKLGYFGDDGGKFKLQDTGGGPVYDRFVVGSNFAFLTGSVGIGITNPGYKLSVYGGDAIFTQYTGIGNGSYLIIANSTTTTDGTALQASYFGSGGYGPLKFEVGGSERMRITSDGTLMVGTTSQTYNNSTYGYIASFKGAITTQAYLSVALSNQTSTSQGMLLGLTNVAGEIYVLDNKPLVLYTNSTEKMRIAADGNIGIGTTAPGAKLDVIGAIRSYSSAGNYGQIFNGSLFAVGSHSGTFMLDLDNTGTADLVNIKNSGTSRFYITNGGNVGIGITSPNTQLHLFGTGDQAITIQSTTTGASTAAFIKHIRVTTGSARSWWTGVGIQGGTDDSYSFYDATAGAERMRITGNGNVGIGTTNPDAKLEVYNSGTAFANIKAGGGDYAYLQLTTPSSDIGYLIKNTATGNSALNKSLYLWNGDGPIQFVPSGIIGNAVTINTSGNLGIGTTSPATALQVNGTARATRLNSTGGIVDFDAQTGNNFIQIASSIVSIANGGNVNMTITSAGNVGIGTASPVSKLNISDGVSMYTAASGEMLQIKRNTTNGSDSAQTRITLGNSSNTFAISYGGTTDRLRFIDGGIIEVLTLQNGGNVGIGTTSPTYKLDVNGSIRTSGVGGLYIDASANFGDNSGANFDILNLGSTRALRILGTSNGGWGNILLNPYGANVGIGTTSPTATLEVIGNIKATSFTGSFSGSITHAVSASYALTASYALNAGDSIWTGSAGNIYYNQGNVGIGTTNPGSTLDINTSTYGLTTNAVILQNINGDTRSVGQFLGDPGVYNVVGAYGTNTISGSIAGIKFNWYSDNWMVSATRSSGTPIYGFVISRNGSEKFVIGTDGNVGIGTTNPGNKLTVYSDTTADGILVDVLSRPRITLRDRGNSDTIIGTGDYGLDDFFIDTYSGNAFAIDGATRYVGIGTTNPANKLVVTSDATFNSENSYSIAAASATNPDFKTVLGYDYANDIGVLAAVRMGVTWKNLAIASAGGNVGIGTTSPTRKLDVNGTSIFRDFTTVVATNGNPVSNITWLSTDSGLMNIYTGGSATVQLNSNGVSYFNGGNVGIGTTSPDIYSFGGGKLLTVSDTSTYSVLVLASGGTNSGGISMGNQTIRRAAIDHLNGSHLVFYTNGSNSGTSVSERMRIASDGNIGIGSTAPVSPLDVNGIISSRGIFIAQNSGTYNVIYNASNSVTLYLGGSGDPGNYYDNTYHNFRSAGGGTTYAVINNNGNLGIGTASPNAKLEVVNSGRILGILRAQSTPLTTFYDNTFAIGTDNGGANGFIYTSGTGGTFPLDYYGELILQSSPRTGYNNGISLVTGTTSPSVKLRVAENGNVGIGTTNPSQKLEVNGRVIVGGGLSGDALSISTSIGTYTFNGYNLLTPSSFLITAGSSGYLSLDGYPIIFKVSGGEKMRVNTDGNVGIGTTSPTTKFVVSNAGASGFEVDPTGGVSSGVLLQAYNRSTSAYMAQSYYALTHTFSVGSGAGTRALDITSAGNVGIGSASPAAKLDIVGTGSTLALSFGNTVPNNPLFINTYGGWSGIGMDQTTAGLRLVGDYSSGASPLVDIGYYSSATVGHATWVNRFRVLNDGNVGIGTISPSQKLEVNGGDALIRNAFIGLIPSYGSNYTSFSHTSRSAVNKYSFLSGNAGDTYVNASNGYSIFFRQENIDQMVITGGGNVGIGTASPPYKLSVVTAGTLGFSLTTAASTVGGPQIDLYDATRAQETVISSTDGTTVGTYLASYSNHPLLFGTNAGSSPTARMVILPSGNVGIASVAPAFALDVNGIVRATALIETSAKKYKTNIQNLEPQLNKVLQLQPVTFDWKEKKQERPSIGLIADDVINIYPEFVVKNKEDEIEGIDYSKLTAVLIQSVKELKEIIDRQQEQINALLTK